MDMVGRRRLLVVPRFRCVQNVPRILRTDTVPTEIF